MASQCAAKRCLPSSTEVTWRSMPAAAASTSASSSAVCASTRDQYTMCCAPWRKARIARNGAVQSTMNDIIRLVPVRGSAKHSVGAKNREGLPRIADIWCGTEEAKPCGRACP